MFLLDTDTCIGILRGEAHFRERLRKNPPYFYRICLPTVYELQIAIEKVSQGIEHKKRSLQNLRRYIPTLPLGEEEAKDAAKIRAILERQNHPIGPTDNIVAACARVGELTLVTGRFEKFKHVPGLKVISWNLR